MTSLLQKRAIAELVANGGTVAHAMRTAGYSPNTARTPKKLTTTKAFQKAVKPLLTKLDEQINKIADELAVKDLTTVQHESLARSMDILIKNKQLLSGGATERVFNIEVSEAIVKKNDKSL